MKTNYEIPSVSVSSPNVNDNTGLKNLAGWITRYKEFGLKIDEVSPFMNELFEKGTLAQFEPSLIGIRASSGPEEDFDRYEFDVSIEDFVNIDNNGYDWVNLHFSFQAGHCMMFIESCNQSKVDKISPIMENIFNEINVEPLLEEEFSRNITWHEADDIILKYLEYVKNPKILPVPR